MHEAAAVSTANIKTIVYLCLKRFIDIIAGIIGLLILIPIALVIKIISMCNGDFHRIIFVQKRIGKNGKEFDFYKFRSMVPNADEILFKLMEENEEIRKEYQENKKLKDDPRITKIGHFIRKTSIDELPQLINILKGDMTIIGPRALLVKYLPLYTKEQRKRHTVKPGLVGLAALNGRNNQSWEEKFKADIYYAENVSFLLDLKIFLGAIKVTLSSKGVAMDGEATMPEFNGSIKR